MCLDGVEIFTNSSGSHHELRKLQSRVRLITEATLKVSIRLINATNRLYIKQCACSVVASTCTQINKVVTVIDYTTMAAPWLLSMVE
jgi:hypothetical protein